MLLKRLLFKTSWLLLLAYSTFASAATLNEAGAIEYLDKKIAHSKAYASWTTPECLRYYTEEKTREYFDIRIYERHGGVCAGDPDNEPLIDRFRVYRSSHKILWREIGSDRLLSFSRFVKSRKSVMPQ
ncbi:hypothetical protein A7981_04240 [Methylovorus sp. MM2]|uniref:hypothetical protein n=1 Tax=Methylovorus sp. MM2 TaxID=1848038 RepID=UPI0007E01F48|nr:hypothetical protein [Methylovorus sp. MM2]OAM52672.1 hypothetical protein A7981_04240 [Methylovorus sp. MM2]